jgi:hypothetical protein
MEADQLVCVACGQAVEAYEKRCRGCGSALAAPGSTLRSWEYRKRSVGMGGAALVSAFFAGLVALAAGTVAVVIFYIPPFSRILRMLGVFNEVVEKDTTGAMGARFLVFALLAGIAAFVVLMRLGRTRPATGSPR